MNCNIPPLGPASVECSETLRQEGFKGRIVLASRENVLPYDRPKLSKVSIHVKNDCVLGVRTYML